MANAPVSGVDEPNSCVELPKDLDALSAAEVAEVMEAALESMSEETYDAAVIDAYLDALDRKAPMPETPDAETAYAGFQQMLRSALLDSGVSAVSASAKRPARHQRLLRAGIVAAVSILCILGGMITAQAAGLDVFGTLAQWTEQVFSFGPIRGDGPQEEPCASEPGENSNGDVLNSDGSMQSRDAFSSLQGALDAYEITELVVPKHFPEGYIPTEVSVTNIDNMAIFTIHASLKKGEEILHYNIMRYTGEPHNQVQKNEMAVEKIQTGNTTYYLVKNEANYTLAWVTDHYECYIAAPEKEVLIEIAQSMAE